MAREETQQWMTEASAPRSSKIPTRSDCGCVGDLDSRADETLAGCLSRGAPHEHAVAHLDFEDVGYINSTGIALVVRLLADARRDGAASERLA
jgi:ABC-type transporter Mla MlaB component